MKNTSPSQQLPQVYLVPKRFHFGVSKPVQGASQQFTTNNNNCSNTVSKRNSKCSDTYEEKWLTSNNINRADIGNTDMMYKKYLQSSGVPHVLTSAATNNSNANINDKSFAHEKLTQSIHIVCKATQSERITQFQLITSNKLGNINKQPDNDTKWCPVDFYDRPRQPFKRREIVSIKFKEPILKSLLLKDINDLKRSDQTENISSLNILYDVTSINEESVGIRSLINLGNNKAFLQLLQCSENDEQWFDIFNLIRNQLGEKFKKMFVSIEVLVPKKK